MIKTTVMEDQKTKERVEIMVAEMGVSKGSIHRMAINEFYEARRRVKKQLRK